MWKITGDPTGFNRRVPRITSAVCYNGGAWHIGQMFVISNSVDFKLLFFSHFLKNTMGKEAGWV